MIESSFSLMAMLGALAAAAFAFARPQGVYMRSAMGLGIAVMAALALWALATPFISEEAGLGAVALFCALTVLGLLAAMAASLAATLRHAVDALTARLH